MTDLSRRRFLQITAASGASLAVAQVPAVEALARGPVPILWGDGKHDDADGLEAFLNCRPVEFARDDLARKCIIGGGRVQLVDGVFRLDRMVVAKAEIFKCFEMTRCTVLTGSNFVAQKHGGLPAIDSTEWIIIGNVLALTCPPLGQGVFQANGLTIADEKNYPSPPPLKIRGWADA